MRWSPVPRTSWRRGAGSSRSGSSASAEPSGDGAAPAAPIAIAAQLATLADALTAIVESLSDDALSAPGGEGDWNVAQVIGHDCESRAGLCLAASLAARGRWPADAAAVVPGIPGAADSGPVRAPAQDRPEPAHRRARRRGRSPATRPSHVRWTTRRWAALRCGEWLVFAGVHDLMHLEQFHGLLATLGRVA